MTPFLTTFFVIYGFIFSMFWLCILCTGGDIINYFSGKDLFDKITYEDWIKALWCSLFWPIYLIYLFFKHNIPFKIIKFIWDSIKFLFRFIIYPFTMLFNIKNINAKIKKEKKVKEKKVTEPFSDKVGKFIVKTFKL